MAITLVQSARAAANASSVVATYGSPTTAGNILVALAYTNGVMTGLTITGWTLGNKINYSGTGQSIGIFYKVADGTETTVTSNGTSICRLHISEFSGLANPAAKEGTNSSTATTVTTIATGNINVSNTTGLIVSAAGTSTGETGSRSWDSSFSTLLDDAASPRLLSGYFITSATGIYGSTATIGTSATNSGAVIFSFQALPLSWQVGASSDDNYEETNGNCNHLTSTNLRLDTSTHLTESIFRITGIPQGATITTSTIKVDPFSITNLTLNCEIYAEAVDTPANLTSANFNISTRTLTTNHVTFSTVLVAGLFSTSNDISAVIQEVVNRAGYTGDIGIILSWNSGTTDLAAWDLLSTDAMILNVTYSTGGGTTTVMYRSLKGVGI